MNTDINFDNGKEKFIDAIEDFLETPEMQTIESVNPHCRHCGKEICGNEDLVFPDS